MRRIAAFACGVALVLGGLPAAPAQGAGWRAEIGALLAARAGAVREGDEAAFMATMNGASRPFRERQRSWFHRLRELPMGSYTLALEPNGYLDLAPALRSRPRAEEVHVVQVTERFGLRGYDAAPGDETLVLTVMRRGTRWSVVSDDDLDDLGLMSGRNMWQFAPVRRAERDGVMVLYHDDEAAARRILDATIAARGRVQRAWPLRWRDRVIVLIPRSARELGRILQTTFDLGPFVAFAASTLHRDAGGAWELVAYRVYVQPETYFDTSIAFQEDTLGHELVHYATRAIAGPFTTSWLEEGVAQEFGERAARPTGGLAAAARSIDGFPEDHDFYIGTRATIHRAYEASAHIVSYLRGRFGDAKVARFYRAVGAESSVAFGTGRYHLDHAARAVLGVGIDALERAWLDRVRKELG